MWQLGPFEELKIETSVVVENIFFSTSGRNVEQRVVVNWEGDANVGRDAQEDGLRRGDDDVVVGNDLGTGSNTISTIWGSSSLLNIKIG